MALSGSFKIGTSNQYIEGELQWSATQSISGNYSDVTFHLYFYRKNAYRTWGSTGNWYVWINGTKTEAHHSYDYPSSQAWVEVHSGTVRVPHNNDGSKQFEIAVDGDTDTHDVNYVTSYPWLDSIPRASNVTSNIDFTAGVNSLSVTVGRASTSFVHTIYLYVQNPNGEWIWVAGRDNVGDSCTFEYNNTSEVTNMYNAITQYENRPAKILCVTYAYQGGGEIGRTEKTGTVYAVATGAMWFSYASYNIGDNVTGVINNYNSNFTYDATLTFGSVTIPFSNVGQYPSLSFDSSQINSLYAQVPNSNSGTATVTVRTKYNNVYTEDGIPNSHDTTFTFNVTNSNPTFGTGYTYADTNTTITTVTGNDQYIVQGKSNLKVTIPVAQKATSNNSATMVSYEATVNGVVKTATWSSTADVIIDFGTVNATSNVTLTVKAIDSRGNSTPTTKTINIVPYSSPIAVTNATRLNGFEAETTVTLNGSVSALNVNGVNKNSVVSAKYQYRESGGIYNALANFTYSGFPSYSATNVTLTLDNLKSWDISIVVTDKLGSTTVVKTVGVGQPIMFMDATKKSVGIGMFPKANGTLETAGDVITDIPTGEKAQKFRTANGEIGLYANNNNGATIGMYDWGGSQGIFNYNRSTKTLDFEVIPETMVGGSSLRLKAGNNQDHVYMEFYPRSSDLTSRGGYFGYPNAGSTELVIQNQVGAITFEPLTSMKVNGGNGINSVFEPKTYAELPLYYPYTQYGGGYQYAYYWKSVDGFVHLQGMVKSGGYGAGSWVGQLPVGCRPFSTSVFATATAGAVARVDVGPDGIITFQGPGDAANYLSLDGIVFKAEK